MKRVAIIGCPGGGKSTCALRLARLSGLPLFYLDTTYHDASLWSADVAEKKQQWRRYQESLITNPEWIIDGNYKGTLELRVSAADTILYLDYPRWLCLTRALLRSLRWYIKRKSIAGGNPGRVDGSFLAFIWSYRTVERPKVLELLTQHQDGKQIHIFTEPKQLERFLKERERECHE